MFPAEGETHMLAKQEMAQAQSDGNIWASSVCFVSTEEGLNRWSPHPESHHEDSQCHNQEMDGLLVQKTRHKLFVGR